MHVLEDRQARHQPRRQRRASEGVRIDHPEPLLEEAPVDRSRELHHRMSEVDNLVEPRPEEIALPRLPRSFGRMKAPVATLDEARESRLGCRINLQENPSTTAATRQTRLPSDSSKFAADQELGS